jgi:citrate lyase subunit beta-like protein
LNKARRAFLYVPGNDLHKIQKSASLNADCICLDLEDSVSPNQKTTARQMVAHAFTEMDFGEAEKWVRINNEKTGLMEDDLAAILPVSPHGIVLPKVETAAVIQRVSRLMDEIETTRGWQQKRLSIIAIVESAAGLINLASICQADERLKGIIFGAEDFAASIGAQRSEKNWEVFHARSEIVIHCAAFGLQAIDMVNNNYRDLEPVIQEARQGAALGFSGKQVIHPSQVEVVQSAFTPSPQEVARARQVVALYKARRQAGKGAIGLEGKLIDLPVFRQAENVLARYRKTQSS